MTWIKKRKQNHNKTYNYMKYFDDAIWNKKLFDFISGL